MAKKFACEEGDLDSIPGQEDPVEKGMTTHSAIPAWKIPWAEDPGGLESMGSQRVGHDWETNTDIIAASIHHLLCADWSGSSSQTDIPFLVFPALIWTIPT